MERRIFIKNLGLITATIALPAQELLAGVFKAKQPVITGRVTAKGKGLAGVLVSDGYDIVQTNAIGEYTIDPHSNADFVFLITPSGYQFNHNKGVAQFYTAIDSNVKAQTISFDIEPLTISDEKHAFIIWGDTQILDKEDAKQLNEVSAPATRKIIESLGNQPLHGITVGDLVFDKFELFPDYKAAVEKTGIPYFQVIGNHDMDLGARSDDLSQETFKKEFGPTYYSFNRGKVHYVVLDDVFMIKPSRGYIGYLTENQLAWLEKDLALVPEGSTVIVSLHIPTKTGAAKRNGAPESPGGVVSNRDILYKMLKPFNAHIMSAHTHVNENWVDGNLMEHNHGTVCGAWWSGPVCSDGCPPGLAVYQVNGNELTWKYHSLAGTDDQIRAYAPGKSLDKPEAVVANVWNWDPAWKVEWMQDGKAMGEMERFVGNDPLAYELYLGPTLPAKHKWVEPSKTEHLFAATPAAGAKEILIIVTDRFGKVFESLVKV